MDPGSSPFADVLRQYPDFADVEAGEPPIPWTYMPADASPLAELRERYGLGALVGDKPEVEVILALLGWAYRAVPHDGGADSPEPRDALTILRYHQATGAPVNCRMKAILLNEAMLATGFRSRYVTCHPAEPDGDCHVVVLVFAASLRRWLTVDPTHDTFFVGAAGQMLNIVEARSAYRSGRAPGIRPIAQEVTEPLYCAGIECRTYGEFYRLYMAKNSFRFECFADSEAGIDSRDDAPLVRLEPLGYETADGAGANSRPVTVTRSTSRFLAAPEM